MPLDQFEDHAGDHDGGIHADDDARASMVMANPRTAPDPMTNMMAAVSRVVMFESKSR